MMPLFISPLYYLVSLLPSPFHKKQVKVNENLRCLILIQEVHGVLYYHVSNVTQEIKHEQIFDLLIPSYAV